MNLLSKNKMFAATPLRSVDPMCPLLSTLYFFPSSGGGLSGEGSGQGRRSGGSVVPGEQVAVAGGDVLLLLPPPPLLPGGELPATVRNSVASIVWGGSNQ